MNKNSFTEPLIPCFGFRIISAIGFKLKWISSPVSLIWYTRVTRVTQVCLTVYTWIGDKDCNIFLTCITIILLTLSEYALYTEIFNVLTNSDNVHLQVCHTAMNLSSFCECFQAHIFVHILDLVDIHLRFLGHVVWWWIQEFMPLGKYLHLPLLSADHLY